MKQVFLILFVLTFSVRAQSALDFTLPSLEGDEITLSEVLENGPVLINFWATWCKPCKQEMDEIQTLFEDYAEKGVQFFAISVDAEKSISKVKPYIKSKGYTFPVLLDTNGDVARDYYVDSVPFSLLISKEGEIVYSNLGYKKGDEIKLKEAIKNLIK